MSNKLKFRIMEAKFQITAVRKEFKNGGNGLDLSSEHHFVVVDDQSMKGVVHGNAAEVVGGA